jgi:hypothetical protein
MQTDSHHTPRAIAMLNNDRGPPQFKGKNGEIKPKSGITGVSITSEPAVQKHIT